MTTTAVGRSGETTDVMTLSEPRVSLTLVLARRVRAMRIIDFRAGTSARKRAAVLELARSERMERLYTIVERDEAATWISLGFFKDGTIPAFYKRSDAVILGTILEPARVPFASETRLVAARAADDVDDMRRRVEASTALVANDAFNASMHVSATQIVARERAERLLARAKRVAQRGAIDSMRVKIATADDRSVRRAIAEAWRSREALSAFEPMSADGERLVHELRGRGESRALVAEEREPCFGNVFVDFLEAPQSSEDAALVASGLDALATRSDREGAPVIYGFAPADDELTIAAWLCAGFRRTGFSHRHLPRGDRRRDAFLMTRKLSGADHD